MNMYFTNITKHRNLKASKISHQEELLNILDTFKNHMNVQRIKLANFHSNSTLNFSKVTESEVRKKILNLSSKKVTKNGASQNSKEKCRHPRKRNNMYHKWLY